MQTNYQWILTVKNLIQYFIHFRKHYEIVWMINTGLAKDIVAVIGCF